MNNESNPKTEDQSSSTVQDNHVISLAQSPMLAEVPYEYGAMSSKFRLMAADKRTAYATMCIHYQSSNHMIAIYSPESSKEDSWISLTGKVSERLDEIFGGEGSFDTYLENHVDEIRKCYDSITRVV